MISRSRDFIESATEVKTCWHSRGIFGRERKKFPWQLRRAENGKRTTAEVAKV
jgi:hypothetical protein